MPNYDYKCIPCDVTFERQVPMESRDMMPCPICGVVATRLQSAPGIAFKGTGFYRTDYKDKP